MSNRWKNAYFGNVGIEPASVRSITQRLNQGFLYRGLWNFWGREDRLEMFYAMAVKNLIVISLRHTYMSQDFHPYLL